MSSEAIPVVKKPTRAFAIPAALSASGAVVEPSNGTRDDSYVCPACLEPVIFKVGEVRAPHFSHRPDTQCNPETVLHRAAKLLLDRAANAWMSGAPAPVVEQACWLCETSWPRSLTEFIPTIDSVRQEVQVAEGFVLDVALGWAGSTTFGLEVLVTHEVDTAKAAGLPVPFVELDGRAILADSLHWYPLRDTLPAFTCTACHEALATFRKETSRISAGTGVPIPESYYRYAPTECWSCHKEILVFDWPDAEPAVAGQEALVVLLRDEVPTGMPVPRTVQHLYSQTVHHRYWGNCCSRCGKLQGDTYMHAPYGPFYYAGHGRGPDSDEGFHRAQMILASYHYGPQA